MVIADRDVCCSNAAWLERTTEAAHALARWPTLQPILQLRLKSLHTDERSELLGAVRARIGDVRVSLNGTSDEARRYGIGCVHLPEAMAHLRAQTREFVGQSLHGPKTFELPPDYVVFAPVFSAGSKAAAGRGIDALTNVVEQTNAPVVALGGITPERVGACLRAGAAGVAVVSGVMCATEISRAIERYVEALMRADQGGSDVRE